MEFANASVMYETYEACHIRYSWRVEHRLAADVSLVVSIITLFMLLIIYSPITIDCYTNILFSCLLIKTTF